MARRCPEKIFFLAYITPRTSLSVQKKFQPNQSCRLAGYRKHIYIYECLVILHRFLLIKKYLTSLKSGSKKQTKLHCKCSYFNIAAHKKITFPI